MNPFDAVVLGFIQGLTEFLPISSSAHVQIAEQLLGISNLPKPQLTAFIATIQLGTEAAVLLYFWKDIVRILSAWFRSFGKMQTKSLTSKTDAKLGWLVIIGSIPVIALGLLFKKQIESDLRNLWVIAIALIVFGIILAVADKFGKRTKSVGQISYKHGVYFGIGQALAVIPGVSRSGGTISVGLALGYSREAAARFSFLLAIPAVLASGVYEFLSVYKNLGSELLLSTVVATIVSFAVGFSVIVAFLKYLNRGSFLPFVIWRIALGLALLGGLSANLLTA